MRPHRLMLLNDATIGDGHLPATKLDQACSELAVYGVEGSPLPSVFAVMVLSHTAAETLRELLQNSNIFIFCGMCEKVSDNYKKTKKASRKVRVARGRGARRL